MAGEASFGAFFKALRIKRGETLRLFCEKYGFDPGNISKLERGLLPPPQSRAKLEEYARALGLEEGSDDWYEFLDLAAIARGQIPRALLNDREILRRLPLVFRTLQGQPVTPEQIDELIELIRGN